MEKLLYTLLALALLTSCGGSYNVEGTSNISTLDGRKLYLKVLKDNEYKKLDSCDVVHGKFGFSGSLDSVCIANIFMDDESVLPLVLEDGKIVVKLDDAQQSVSGTPLNDKLFKFFNKYNQLKNQEQELLHKHDQAIMNGSNMDVVNARLTIGYDYPELTPWIEDIMSKATDKFKNDAYVKDYYAKAQENQQIMNGMKDVPVSNSASTTTTPPVAPAPTPNDLAKPAK